MSKPQDLSIRRHGRRVLLTSLGASALFGSLVTSRRARAAVTPATPAPDFTLKSAAGANLRLGELRGRVVLVNFWATWCPPCRAEIPSMERAWAKLKEGGVAMLAVHVGGDSDKIWGFLADFNVTFPVLIDKSSKVSKEWQTIGLPTTYVADGQGRKALRAIGGREWDQPDLIASILALRP